MDHCPNWDCRTTQAGSPGKGFLKRIFIIVVLILVGLFAAGIAIFYIKNRPVLAFACPQCFGFHAIADGAYSNEPSSPRVPEVLSNLHAARSHVQHFFRRPVPKPTLLICTTERCYRHAEGKGGVAKALSWSTRILLVSPRGSNATIISHELTHIEFRNILGITAYAQVPSWFDEGLAVYVSNDLRYLKPPGTKDRCLVSGHDALPDTNPMWWQTLN